MKENGREGGRVGYNQTDRRESGRASQGMLPDARFCSGVVLIATGAVQTLPRNARFRSFLATNLKCDSLLKLIAQNQAVGSSLL